MVATRRTTIFTKRPAPGEVKTRLSPPLSAGDAAELALAMLDDTVASARASSEFVTRLAVAPAESLAWFRERYAGLEVVAQVGPGLGPRLAAHFDAELALTATTSVVIGTDAPHLGTERIVRAHEALEDGTDLVLAPDEGGGYHLVGLGRAYPALFTEIPMSTGDMCARTVALAESHGLTVELLASGFDVDTPDDLQRLVRLVREAAEPPRELNETARVLARLVPPYLAE